MKNLWGDRFFNPKTKKWTNQPDGEGSKRGFNQFILDPIFKVKISISLLSCGKSQRISVVLDLRGLHELQKRRSSKADGETQH